MKKLFAALAVAFAAATPLFAEDPKPQPKLQTYVYRIEVTRPEMLTKGPTPDEMKLLGEHFAYLKDLTKKGVLIFAGRTLTTTPDAFGIIVFRAESPEAAAKIMEGDASVHGGVMRAKVYPFDVVLMEGKPVE